MNDESISIKIMVKPGSDISPEEVALLYSVLTEVIEAVMREELSELGS